MPVVVKFENLPFGVFPLEDGDKVIEILHKETNTVYQLPLDPKAAHLLSEQLSKSNKELRETIDNKE